MPSPTDIISALHSGLIAAADPVDAAHKSFAWFELHRMDLIDAASVLVIGIAASGWLGRVAHRAMERRNLEPPVRYLLVRLLRFAILGLALTMALDNLGFKFTALLAGVGGLGVGIGFGMQSMVSNMIAGVTLIFTKPSGSANTSKSSACAASSPTSISCQPYCCAAICRAS